MNASLNLIPTPGDRPRQTRSLATRLGACALVCGTASTQNWVLRTPLHTPVQAPYPAMAFDSLRGVVVLTGGNNNLSTCSETWEYNGTDWTQRTSAPSGCRAEHAMAFDSMRGRIVIFGGSNYLGMIGDTEEWDGSTWTASAALSSPPPRSGHAMVFDSMRGRIVLFGGWAYLTTPQLGYRSPLGDTYEYDGANWSTCIPSTSPSPRFHHAMAFDTSRQRTVLFGGNDNTVAKADTWEWDGANWALANPVVSPPPRSQHSMAFDSYRAKSVVFGGSQTGGNVGGPAYSDTWEWDGHNWSQGFTGNPPASFYQAMAYDSHRSCAVMFGGALTTQTWELQTTVAESRNFGQGCGNPPLAMSAAGGLRPLIGSTQVTNVINIPAFFALMAIGSSSTTLGAIPLPLSLDVYGLPGCNLYHDLAFDLAELCTPTGTGTATHSLQVPNNAALLGLTLYLQAWASAPSANAANLTTSNAIALTIGNA